MGFDGRRVVANHDIHGDDWYEFGGWADNDNPIIDNSECVAEGTHGTIIGEIDELDCVTVKFDTGIEWMCTLQSTHTYDGSDVRFLRYIPGDYNRERYKNRT